MSTARTSTASGSVTRSVTMASTAILNASHTATVELPVPASATSTTATRANIVISHHALGGRGHAMDTATAWRRVRACVTLVTMVAHVSYSIVPATPTVMASMLSVWWWAKNSVLAASTAAPPTWEIIITTWTIEHD